MTSRLSAQELASLRQAARLSTADAQDPVQLASSSSRPKLPPDEALAIQLWQQELQTFSSGLQDQQLARDLDRAQRSGVSLDTIRRQRERLEPPLSSRVRVAQFALGPPGSPLFTSTADSPVSISSPSAGPSGNIARPVAAAAATTSQAPWVPPSEERCVICLGSDDFLRKFTLCGHCFCRKCLDRAFLLAARDESLFPPKCCQQAILTDWALPLVSSQTARAFDDAKKGYATKNRVYCYRSECSTLLGGDFKTKVDLTCSQCGRQTCSACKSPKHLETQACAADNDDDAATKLAKQVHGVRCKSCLRVLERYGGCEHVLSPRVLARAASRSC